MVSKIFWSIAAAEAVFFVVALVMTATESGPNPNGGKGMAIVFQIALPFLILAVISLIYWKTSSAALHIILLIAVTIPMAVLAGQWIRGPLMDRDIAVGGYVFEDPKLKKFVAAVANLDSQKVRELAPGVDVNTVGQLGLTPLKFAIERVNTPGDTAEQKDARIAMIRLLLSLGAKPDSALPKACFVNNVEIVGILLDQGANPNYKDEEGTPAFFSCPRDAEAVLRLLAQKGADFNALDAKGEGALINAATFSQWEKMLFFLDHGVKDTATVNGKNAAAKVAQAIVDDKQNSRTTSPALAELAAKLNH